TRARWDGHCVSRSRPETRPAGGAQGLAHRPGPLFASDRFLQEIQLAARLQHPHILPVFDSGEEDAGGPGGRQLWYTMPYVEGQSLRDRLRREIQLPVEEA